ncbi:MAG: hypothetical protein E7453_01320 [Ruminococcaceae bacterium]|nr:hypothetical protein [Oscillospiraceae bacterium]
MTALKKYHHNKINNNTTVLTVENAEFEDFLTRCEALRLDGYEEIDRRNIAQNTYVSYRKGDEGVFLNYYPSVQELAVVTEKECRYFAYHNEIGGKKVQPSITQIHLVDFGMSYVIRLSDGRFIILDGGREYLPDARELYDCLKRDSVAPKPVIAAWIMTHPHSDHYHCYMTFMDHFADEVVIEKYMFTFPEHDDVDHYPTLIKKDPRFEDNSPFTNIPRMLERMHRSGAPIYSPHTGQRYIIGDAVCDIIGSIDDTIHRSQNINATSVIIRMELGGQVILWCADAAFSETRLAEKYGQYLKSDILQVPHHGFQSGTAEAEIKGYRYIKPSVCLLPVSDYNAYTVFCAFKEGTKFLMQDMDIDEMITGDTTRTLLLPYTPAPEGKNVLRRNYTAGQNSAGARTWIYTGLNTGREEDLVFQFINTTHMPTMVNIELFFEEKDRNVRHIKAQIPPLSYKSICVVGGDVDGDFMYFNWMSLKERGVPENANFAIRFISDVPIVVAHKKYSATYYSG